MVNRNMIQRKRIGETNAASLLGLILEAAASDPGPFEGATGDIVPLSIETVSEPERLVLDPKGYLIVYPDRLQNRLVLEHYNNEGVLSRMFAADSPAAMYGAVIEAGLISRLDHAAYLGRELARAERALQTGEEYTQDRAPGDISESSSCCSSGSCS